MQYRMGTFEVPNQAKLARDYSNPDGAGMGLIPPMYRAELKNAQDPTPLPGKLTPLQADY
jgi:hypothetical protein